MKSTYICSLCWFDWHNSSILTLCSQICWHEQKVVHFMWIQTAISCSNERYLHHWILTIYAASYVHWWMSKVTRQLNHSLLGWLDTKLFIQLRMLAGIQKMCLTPHTLIQSSSTCEAYFVLLFITNNLQRWTWTCLHVHSRRVSIRALCTRIAKT